MAFQTLTTTTTPTPQPTASSSDGTGNDPDAQSTAFSPAGSPPLILAFLAIGLFSAAMIIVFGWRRVQFGPHGWRLGQGPTNDRTTDTPPPKTLPNKPKLWDIWSDGLDASWTDVAGSRKEGWHNDHLFWENMTPLTANASPTADETDILEKATIPETIPLRHSFFRGRGLFQMGTITEPNAPAGGGRQLLRMIHRQSLKSVDTSPPTPTLPTSTLQVGFIIIMPSERHPIHVSLKKNINQESKKERERKEITDYSIGIYEYPWDQ